MSEQVILQNGMDVYGADDAKLGSIHEVRDNYFIVEKGFFFPKDYYIPVSAIEGVDADNRVYLNVTKDVALNQGWDTLPADGYAGNGSQSNAAYGTTNQVKGSTDQTYGEMGVAGKVSGKTWGSTTGIPAAGGKPGRTGASEVISPNYTAATDTPVTDAEATRVPVYEEEITPVKRPVDRGKVRIEKELVTEDKTITVPVTEERVRVTRVDTNESAPTDAGDLFREGVIEVPVRGEEVDLQKTARKTGEVRVEKEAVQHDEKVSGKVRREEVHVDDATVSDKNLTSQDLNRRKSA